MERLNERRWYPSARLAEAALLSPALSVRTWTSVKQIIPAHATYCTRAELYGQHFLSLFIPGACIDAI